MYLNNLNINEEAIITELKVEENIKRRLMDIGLIKGTKIKVVLQGNNITAYQIKGTVIALRKEDTKNIKVEKI